MRLENKIGCLFSQKTPVKTKEKILKKIERAIYYKQTNTLTAEQTERITPHTPMGSKYGHSSIIIVPNKKGFLIKIPIVNIKFQYGWDVKKNEPFCKIDFGNFTRNYSSVRHGKKEFKTLTKQLKKTIEEKIDKIVGKETKKPFPIKPPESLLKLVELGSKDILEKDEPKIVKVYKAGVVVNGDLTVSVNIEPLSLLIRISTHWIEIDKSNKIYYQEDFPLRLAELFAELYPEKYVVLENKYLIKPYIELWKRNKEFGFWTYYFSPMLVSMRSKRYRTNYDPATFDTIPYSDENYSLFKIIKITEKSIWLKPIINPVKYMLSKLNLKVYKEVM